MYVVFVEVQSVCRVRRVLNVCHTQFNVFKVSSGHVKSDVKVVRLLLHITFKTHIGDLPW